MMLTNASTPGTHLIARVYLKLGTWQRELTPILDDESIQGNYFLMNILQRYNG